MSSSENYPFTFPLPPFTTLDEAALDDMDAQAMEDELAQVRQAREWAHILEEVGNKHDVPLPVLRHGGPPEPVGTGKSVRVRVPKLLPAYVPIELMNESLDSVQGFYDAEEMEEILLHKGAHGWVDYSRKAVVKGTDFGGKDLTKYVELAADGSVTELDEFATVYSIDLPVAEPHKFSAYVHVNDVVLMPGMELRTTIETSVYIDNVGLKSADIAGPNFKLKVPTK